MRRGGICTGDSLVQVSDREQGNQLPWGGREEWHALRYSSPTREEGLNVGEETAAEMGNWLIQGVIKE